MILGINGKNKVKIMKTSITSNKNAFNYRKLEIANASRRVKWNFKRQTSSF